MRFLCDAMLGKLAKYLRLLGFDAAYAATPSALDRARKDAVDLVFLTRRKAASGLPHTVVLASDAAREQLKELAPLIKQEIRRERVLNRCIECNQELVATERSEVEFLVPEFVFHTYRTFKKCPSCERIYWEGSHAKGMEDLIKEVLS